MSNTTLDEVRVHSLPVINQLRTRFRRCEGLEIKRGSVFWVDFRDSTGSELSGIHPGLVMSPDFVNGNPLNTVFNIVPTTSLKEKTRRWKNVIIQPPEGGLRHPSIVVINMYQPADVTRILGRLGTVSSKTIGDVERAILEYFNYGMRGLPDRGRTKGEVVRAREA